MFQLLFMNFKNFPTYSTSTQKDHQAPNTFPTVSRNIKVYSIQLQPLVEQIKWGYPDLKGSIIGEFIPWNEFQCRPDKFDCRTFLLMWIWSRVCSLEFLLSVAIKWELYPTTILGAHLAQDWLVGLSQNLPILLTVPLPREFPRSNNVCKGHGIARIRMTKTWEEYLQRI